MKILFIQFIQSSVPHIRSEIHSIMMICQEIIITIVNVENKKLLYIFWKETP